MQDNRKKKLNILKELVHKLYNKFGKNQMVANKSDSKLIIRAKLEFIAISKKKFLIEILNRKLQKN